MVVAWEQRQWRLVVAVASGVGGGSSSSREVDEVVGVSDIVKDSVSSGSGCGSGEQQWEGGGWG